MSYLSDCKLFEHERHCPFSEIPSVLSILNILFLNDWNSKTGRELFSLIIPVWGSSGFLNWSALRNSWLLYLQIFLVLYILFTLGILIICMISIWSCCICPIVLFCCCSFFLICVFQFGFSIDLVFSSQFLSFAVFNLWGYLLNELFIYVYFSFLERPLNF